MRRIRARNWIHLEIHARESLRAGVPIARARAFSFLRGIPPPPQTRDLREILIKSYLGSRDTRIYVIREFDLSYLSTRETKLRRSYACLPSFASINTWKLFSDACSATIEIYFSCLFFSLPLFFFNCHTPVLELHAHSLTWLSLLNDSLTTTG